MYGYPDPTLYLLLLANVAPTVRHALYYLYVLAVLILVLEA
jgi:hypothetical protein